MHVTIITIGSRGDVQPYVALGRGLRQAGHQVRLITHGAFQAVAEQNCLDFGVIEANPKEILSSDAGQAWVESGQNTLRFLHQQIKLGAPIMRSMLDDAWRACTETDLVIFSVFGVPGYHIAQKLGAPCAGAWLQPLSRTRQFPSLIVPPTWRLGPTFNWVSHIVAEWMMWVPFQRDFNQWRRETLGLPALPLSGPFKQFRRQQMPVLYGYSPSVFPKPADWPDRITVTGYWFLDHPDDWQPPADLVEFLGAGPPPVYVGFGSMPSRDPAALLGLVTAALQQTGQRGVLLTGWGGLRRDTLLQNLPKTIFAIESVPHDWLFPQMAAIVHHGGAGTTAAALRSGAPSIIVPFFADQPFWGHRVAALGVGPQPIMRPALTAERLAQAIQTSLEDETMRSRAAALGAQIRAEDGVARAVGIIEKIFK